MKEYKDIIFKSVEGHGLGMDIFVPDEKNPPLIMWIHGGGWNELNKNWYDLIAPMLSRGYAVATVDYRYSDEAPFPAQMLDLKDALLFIKKNGSRYGYDASKIAVSGDSAGGHLCSMMGVSVGNADWERPGEDYSLQAVVVFNGPSYFTFPQRKSGQGEDEINPIELLLGAPADTKAGKIRAAAASPLTYIDGTEPPFLIIHGTDDDIVDPVHARKLRNALEEAGSTAMMYYVPGGEHGMMSPIINDVICEFLDYYLKGRKTVIRPELQSHHWRTLPKRA